MGLAEYRRRQNIFVQSWLGDERICERCGATLATFDSACSAELDDPCPGYLAIDAAIEEFRGPGAN